VLAPAEENRDSGRKGRKAMRNFEISARTTLSLAQALYPILKVTEES
jgi:hypothetical protein